MAEIKLGKADQISTQRYGFGVRHIQMICMCFTMTSLFIARSSLGVAILAMTDERRRNDTNVEVYKWDKNTQGLILSSFFWGYTIMQIPAGLLANKFGGKPILLISLLASGVICLLIPTVASMGWWMVCICRVAMGLTQACLFPATHTLLGRWLPASERTAMAGFVNGGTQIGTIIAMPISGVLAETAAGWKVIFYAISGLMFVTAVIWYSFTASSPGEHSLISKEEKYYIEIGLNSGGSMANRPIPWKDILSTRPLWAILVTHVGFSVTFLLFFVDMPTYLEMALKISLKNSAILSALPYIGMWIGSVVSSIACEWIYNKGLLSVTTSKKLFNSIAHFGVGLALIVLSLLGPEHQNIAIVTLIVGLTLVGFTAAGFMTNQMDLSPQFGGVMVSLTNFVGSLFSMGLPVLNSLILRNDSSNISRWHIVFLIVAAISIGSNIVYVIFGSAERQPWDRPDYHIRMKADPEEMKPVLAKLTTNEEEKNQETNFCITAKEFTECQN